MPGLSRRGLCKEGQDVAGYRNNRQKRVLGVRVGRGWPKRFLIPSRREAPYRGTPPRRGSIQDELIRVRFALPDRIFDNAPRTACGPLEL